MPIVHQLRLEFDAKACTRCGEVKSLSEYHRQSKQPDGHKSYCKVCCKAINAELYQRNREVRRLWMRAYYAEHKAAIKAKALRYYYANQEHVKRRVLGWNQSHSEQRRIYNMRLRHRNPEAYREVWRRRQARKRSLSTVRFTSSQLKAKCAYWGNRCWICGGPQEAIDHVKPLNKGGAHILCNLRPICRACNTRKLDKWPYP
jgi:5-methylcytosine-specific restriction endonuclease McrA